MSPSSNSASALLATSAQCPVCVSLFTTLTFLVFWIVVEVMELRLVQTTDEDLRLKEENEELRSELSRLRIDLNKSINSSSSSPRR